MAKIIGNPTTTPIAPSDWNQNNPIKANNIKNKPTKLSQFINDIDSLPSVVYTELDNFTDGVCKVKPKSPSDRLYFNGEEFTEGDNSDYDYYVLSETYALCIASHEIEYGAYDYDYHYQTLIFANGGVYTRYWYKENDEDYGWGKWHAYIPSLAKRAERDANYNVITDTYATKAEVGDIETALDSIIAIQNGLIGGDA